MAPRTHSKDLSPGPSRTVSPVSLLHGLPSHPQWPSLQLCCLTRKVQGWHLAHFRPCVSLLPHYSPVKCRSVAGSPLAHQMQREHPLWRPQGNDGPGLQGSCLCYSQRCLHMPGSPGIVQGKENMVWTEACLLTGAELQTGTLTSAEALPGPLLLYNVQRSLQEALGQVASCGVTAPALVNCRDHVLSPNRSPLCRQTLTSKASCPQRP